MKKRDNFNDENARPSSRYQDIDKQKMDKAKESIKNSKRNKFMIRALLVGISMGTISVCTKELSHISNKDADTVREESTETEKSTEKLDAKSFPEVISGIDADNSVQVPEQVIIESNEKYKYLIEAILDADPEHRSIEQITPYSEINLHEKITGDVTTTAINVLCNENRYKKDDLINVENYIASLAQRELKDQYWNDLEKNADNKEYTFNQGKIYLLDEDGNILTDKYSVKTKDDNIIYFKDGDDYEIMIGSKINGSVVPLKVIPTYEKILGNECTPQLQEIINKSFTNVKYSDGDIEQIGNSALLALNGGDIIELNNQLNIIKDKEEADKNSKEKDSKEDNNFYDIE